MTGRIASFSTWRRWMARAFWLLPLAGIIALIAPFVPIANLAPATLGAIALIGMAASLAIAGRGVWLDRALGGPDKAFAWHRAAGYVAVAGLAGHWLLASSVGAGPIPPLADAGELAGLAAGIGIVGLSAISVLRFVPHHWWRASHWLMGPLFAVSVFHTFLSASPLPAFSPPWLVLLGVSGVGIWGWIASLRKASRGQVSARVTRIERLDGAIEFEVSADAPLPRYRPGQFATLVVPGLSGEPHPFSIAGGSGARRQFGIRVAGDWTARLHRELREGDRVTLGAAQGRFSPRLDDNRKAQIWVAGGAGITPFLAALEAMQPDDAAPVTLVYANRGVSGAIGLTDLRRAEERLPQLRLVLHDSACAGRIAEGVLDAAFADLPRRCDLFMCGPEALKDMAGAAYRRSGKVGRVRHEDFDFRSAWSLADLAAGARRIAQPLANLAATIGRAVSPVLQRLHATTGLSTLIPVRVAP